MKMEAHFEPNQKNTGLESQRAYHIFQNVIRPRYFSFEECPELELVSTDFRKLVISNCYARYKILDFANFRGLIYYKESSETIYASALNKLILLLTKISRFCKCLEDIRFDHSFCGGLSPRHFELLGDVMRLNSIDFRGEFSISDNDLILFLNKAQNLKCIKLNQLRISLDDQVIINELFTQLFHRHWEEFHMILCNQRFYLTPDGKCSLKDFST